MLQAAIARDALERHRLLTDRPQPLVQPHDVFFKALEVAPLFIVRGDGISKGYMLLVRFHARSRHEYVRVGDGEADVLRHGAEIGLALVEIVGLVDRFLLPSAAGRAG